MKNAANALNQYSSRGVPSVAHLLGSADEEATVLVNGQSVTRQNTYWYKGLSVTNTASPQYPEVVVDAVWSNLLESATGHVFVAKTPENFTYDADGNLLADGRFLYSWDGENRLVALETASGAVGAGAPHVLVNYIYDHMSRRIGKRVYKHDGTDWVEQSSHAYLYDGWNLIQESKAQGAVSNVSYYVWGLDLSGTLQGAGGIGGLLSAAFEGPNSATSVFFTYDANGNVGQLLDAVDPIAIQAHYEYSPFGETLLAVGELAEINPFRFSTKYHEDESGLVYYGYRYYNPELGRWINRDPIGEEGFNTVLLSSPDGSKLYFSRLDVDIKTELQNLYRFVFNNAINSQDYLGLNGMTCVHNCRRAAAIATAGLAARAGRAHAADLGIGVGVTGLGLAIATRSGHPVAIIAGGVVTIVGSYLDIRAIRNMMETARIEENIIAGDYARCSRECIRRFPCDAEDIRRYWNDTRARSRTR